MSLCLIATPIGHPLDISKRAIEFLRKSDVIVGEEERELGRLLKILEIYDKPTELLNEHSDQKQLQNIVNLCREKTVALVSDCGTPAFCDPGANLVTLCYAEGIKVTSIPGPSSVMMALSLSGFDLKEFIFKGFVPQKSPERQKELGKLTKENRPIVLMDTPYRLEKLVSEVTEIMPDREAFLGANMTQKDEWSFRGQMKYLTPLTKGKKAEFVLVLGPTKV